MMQSKNVKGETDTIPNNSSDTFTTNILFVSITGRSQSNTFKVLSHTVSNRFL